MKTIYAVFEKRGVPNGFLRPAKYPECKVDPSWDNNEFDSIEEAAGYANGWLGAYSPGYKYFLDELRNNGCVSYDYSGYGDFIVIEFYCY